MRSVRLFGKSIPLLAIVAIAISAGMASAALLSYYGKITTTVNVQQSVLVDGNDYTEPIVDELPELAPGGETFLFKHWLHNRASVPAMVMFEEPIYYPELEDDEIVTTYWLPVEYSIEVETPDGTGSIPAVITVEEIDCSVRWTIDMDETTGPFSNGHAAVALIIGVGNDILYQVHSNDGTVQPPGTYPWGTWLLSFYDPSGGGWYGWHSSDPDWNKPVAEYGIVCTGERDLANNPTLEYTITIPKRLLSCGEFKWAMALMGNTSDTYTPSVYAWSDLDTTNFHTAKVGEEIVDPLVLVPCVDVDFIICHSFAIDITPRTYKITTTIVPA